MIKIAISQAAFDAIVATLPLGSIAYEPQLNDRGERYVWLEQPWVDRLSAMRRQGEDYSAVILQLTAAERGSCRS